MPYSRSSASHTGSATAQAACTRLKSSPARVLRIRSLSLQSLAGLLAVTLVVSSPWQACSP